MIVNGEYHLVNVNGYGKTMFSLHCGECGKILGDISVSEVLAMHKVENVTITEQYYNTILCEKCQFEKLSDTTAEDVKELNKLQQFYAGKERIFSAVETLDVCLV